MTVGGQKPSWLMRRTPLKRTAIRASSRSQGKRSRKTGRQFDSRPERRLGDVLHDRLAAGEITDLRFQVRVDLAGLATVYVDFAYVEDGRRILHEYKGFATGNWAMKLRLIQNVGCSVCDEYRLTTRDGTQAVPMRPNRKLVEAVEAWGR